MTTLGVPEEALSELRGLFAAVEGSCEAWTDEEIVRRLFIRGVMEYAKSAGTPWEEVQATAARVRGTLEVE